MDVKVKDRKKEIEYLRMALCMCQMHVNYEHSDLIIKLQKVLYEKNGEFSIEDAVNVFHKWKEDWGYYYEKLDETKTT